MTSPPSAKTDAARSKLRWVVIGLCALVVVIAALSVIGWRTRWRMLTSFLPKLVTMKPNTALTLLLAAGALCKQFSRAFRYMGDVLCVCALLIACATLWEYATGRSPGMDQMLAVVPIEEAGDPAGRMAIGTAFALFLSSLALLLLDRASWISLAFTSFAGLISLSALVGYAFNAGRLLSVPLLKSMAPRTALSLAVVQLCTVLLRPQREPVRSMLRTVGYHLTGIGFSLAPARCHCFSVGLWLTDTVAESSTPHSPLLLLSSFSCAFRDSLSRATAGRLLA